MPLLHRRSSTRSDFRRLACRPRVMPLGFEASICAGPRSSGPVIHLAHSRSPLRISRSSRICSPDVDPRSHGGLPLFTLRVRSLPCAQDLSIRAAAIICEASPFRVHPGDHGRNPRAVLQAIAALSRGADFASRRSCFAGWTPCDAILPLTHKLGHGRGRTCLRRGLVTSRCFELRVASARSPCGDASVRSRRSDFSSPSRAVSRSGASFQMRLPSGRDVSQDFAHCAMVEAARDLWRTFRCGKFARRSHLGRSRDVRRSLEDPSFDVHSMRGTRLCSPLVRYRPPGAHETSASLGTRTSCSPSRCPRGAIVFRRSLSRPRLGRSVARSHSTAAFMSALRRP
jgi:hypothetical protein